MSSYCEFAIYKVAKLPLVMVGEIRTRSRKAMYR